MSVGARIHESYWTDPLTLAAKRSADAGIVVVTAAGNFGKNAAGVPQYGGITAPGNAPWVLTVGASSTHGHADPRRRHDGAVQLGGPDLLDFAREARPGRARHRHGVARGARQHVLLDEAAVPASAARSRRLASSRI